MQLRDIVAPRIVMEGRDAPLYRAIDELQYAWGALQRNEMLGTSRQRFWSDGKPRRDNDPEYYESYWMKGVSLTRDFSFAKRWGWFVFVFDQTKLARRYRIMPFSWGATIGNHEGIDHRKEREEFLILDKAPNRFVKPDGSKDRDAFNNNDKSIKPLSDYMTGFYVCRAVLDSPHQFAKAGITLEQLTSHPAFLGFYGERDDPSKGDTLTEQASITPDFLSQVRKCVDSISGDWTFDDDADLTQRIKNLTDRIEHACLTSEGYLIQRAELRPEDHIPEGFSSVGCHWSWESGTAQVYHHDNAYDDHGEDVEEVMIDAIVQASDIDWAYTFATNLIHPAEREITIYPGKNIKLDALWVDDMEHPVNMIAQVAGDYGNI